MKLHLVRPVACVAALTMAGCGSAESGSAGSGAEAQGNSADRAFVAGMIPHHESAVEMARIAQERGQSQFVKDLADGIVRTQNAEISTMQAEDAELAEAGVDRGEHRSQEHDPGMEEDPSMLREARSFDSEFIAMMIPHHESAVDMARVELSKGQDPELKKLAREIIAAQEREIAEMRGHRKRGDSNGGAQAKPEQPGHHGGY